MSAARNGHFCFNILAMTDMAVMGGKRAVDCCFNDPVFSQNVSFSYHIQTIYQPCKSMYCKAGHFKLNFCPFIAKSIIKKIQIQKSLDVRYDSTFIGGNIATNTNRVVKCVPDCSKKYK